MSLSTRTTIIPAHVAVAVIGQLQLAVIAWQIDNLTGHVTPIAISGPIEEFDAIIIDGLKQQ